MSTDPLPLWPAPPAPDKPKRETPGPVYQGTSKAIRWLEATADQDREPGSPAGAWSKRMAGTIAQARSLAASIDRESGRDPERKQASGVSLAALHQQLDALMLRLDPQGEAAAATSDWDQLQGELAQLELEQRRRVMDGQE